ncbi:hypothetical protein QT995_25915 [Microcoleus sp. S36b_A3]|uniref:hypothetical protein n=1 Tax=unclassified Microcoleus TaxID=2642155 RepID=UPI002FD52CF1
MDGWNQKEAIDCMALGHQERPNCQDATSHKNWRYGRSTVLSIILQVLTLDIFHAFG